MSDSLYDFSCNSYFSCSAAPSHFGSKFKSSLCCFSDCFLHPASPCLWLAYPVFREGTTTIAMHSPPIIQSSSVLEKPSVLDEMMILIAYYVCSDDGTLGHNLSTVHVGHMCMHGCTLLVRPLPTVTSVCCPPCSQVCS
jgi:hypothetical protein